MCWTEITSSRLPRCSISAATLLSVMSYVGPQSSDKVTISKEEIDARLRDVQVSKWCVFSLSPHLEEDELDIMGISLNCLMRIDIIISELCFC